MSWFRKKKIDRAAAEQWYNRGFAFQEQGRLDEAIECYDKSLDIDPEYAFAWNNKGFILMEQGSYYEAIECYDKALNIDPECAATWHNKGHIFGKLERFDEAIECFDIALDIEPEYTVAWCNKGFILMEQGRFDEAIEFYDRALDIDPESVLAWDIKGHIFGELERFDEAIECYDMALDIDPEDAVAWHNKGFILMEQGSYYEAIECYDKALTIDMECATTWFNKGYALHEQGRFDEAIECYDKALDIDLEDAVAWFNKGYTLQEQGRFDEAIECYDMALDIDQEDAITWHNKGLALREQGRFDEAIECYNEALNIDPEYTDAWCNKGSALRELGKYDEATICDDKAHELDSKSVIESIVEDDLCLDLSISRETEFYQGFIRFKMSVDNTSSFVVTDVALDFDFDDDLLRIDRHEPPRQVKNGKIMLGNITASTSKTVAVYFDPLMCSKGADINCLINYKDAKGQIQTNRMKAKKISVVCPIMQTDSDINIGRLKEFIDKLPHKDSRVYQIQTGFAIDKLKNSCREVIQKHDVKHIRTLSTKDGKTCELWYYGKTKVNSYDIVIRITLVSETQSIELFAATQTAESLSGLLAEVGRELKSDIEDRIIGNVQQVINVSIKDSIVQRSNLLSYCDIDGNCSGDVVIEDSLVQRSNIDNVESENENKGVVKVMDDSKLFEHLVSIVQSGPNIEEIKVEYNEVLTHFNYEVNRGTQKILRDSLNRISHTNLQNDEPFLAAIVVGKRNIVRIPEKGAIHIPGEGFFDLMRDYKTYKGPSDGPEAQKIHDEELKRVFNYWHDGNENSCPACGEAVAKNAKFCMKCGKKIE
jgi:tetratricopeptide (TPR) repeat protein